MGQIGQKMAPKTVKKWDLGSFFNFLAIFGPFFPRFGPWAISLFSVFPFSGFGPFPVLCPNLIINSLKTPSYRSFLKASETPKKNSQGVTVKITSCQRVGSYTCPWQASSEYCSLTQREWICPAQCKSCPWNASRGSAIEARSCWRASSSTRRPMRLYLLAGVGIPLAIQPDSEKSQKRLTMGTAVYRSVHTPEPRNPKRVPKRSSWASPPGVSKKCRKSPRTLILTPFWLVFGSVPVLLAARGSAKAKHLGRRASAAAQLSWKLS